MPDVSSRQKVIVDAFYRREQNTVLTDFTRAGGAYEFGRREDYMPASQHNVESARAERRSPQMG